MVSGRSLSHPLTPVNRRSNLNSVDYLPILRLPAHTMSFRLKTVGSIKEPFCHRVWRQTCARDGTKLVPQRHSACQAFQRKIKYRGCANTIRPLIQRPATHSADQVDSLRQFSFADKQLRPLYHNARRSRPAEGRWIAASSHDRRTRS